MAQGREAAAELGQAVAEGRFKLTAEAAHELAGHYQWLVDMLVERQHELSYLYRIDGFGGFESAQHLQQGFEGKAVQAFHVLRAAEESAYRMKAAVLQAAGLTQEVEAANAAAITAAKRESPNAKT
ncbi:hypothetical protein [Nocardia sp. NPDC051570]|uniref:hypothetical protein n=1 Tax=Nocardia sp. NPDC051570 TaxID=3364324 RepID=UPI00378CF1C4